jgi:hypothetical protein
MAVWVLALSQGSLLRTVHRLDFGRGMAASRPLRLARGAAHEQKNSRSRPAISIRFRFRDFERLTQHAFFPPIVAIHGPTSLAIETRIANVFGMSFLRDRPEKVGRGERI